MRALGLGLSLWQELITGQVNGTQGSYKAIFYASQLSWRTSVMEYLWPDSDWSFYGEGNLYLGQVNLQNQQNSIPKYYRRGASLQGLGVTLGLRQSFSSNKGYLGISLPLIFRQAHLDTIERKADLPELSNQNKSFIAFCGEFGWQMSDQWSLTQSLGTGPELRDAIWQIRIFRSY